MQILRFDSQTVIPWKNGGGTTREIKRMPPDASLDSFDWRVSRAHVASDGPFSSFPGVDRTLLVLTGQGIRLEMTGSGSFTLTPSSDPLTFAGEAAVSATLVDGAIDDLNVMTLRARARHAVMRKRVVERTELAVVGEAMLVVVERGTIVIGDSTLAMGDVLSCEAGEAVIVSSLDSADVVIVQIALLAR